MAQLREDAKERDDQEATDKAMEEAKERAEGFRREMQEKDADR